MGNQVSEQPEEEGPHVEHQERIFKEYTEMLAANPELAQQEAERWDIVKDKILDLPIEQQAEYCDYVTGKICAMDDDIVKSSGEQMKKTFEYVIKNRKKMNTAAIANCAKTIISQKDETLKQELLVEYEKFLQVQRETSEMGSLATQMMGQIQKEIKSGNDPMDISRNLIGQMIGVGVADEIMKKLQATFFIQQKLDEGKTVKEALRLTRDKFDLPAGTKFDVKLTLTLEESEDDDESSE
jgi:hypothetical protein